tara:strand:- start:194 stop:508 length:315 start_codon:yes stop_codon:yes gene_type:complete
MAQDYRSLESFPESKVFTSDGTNLNATEILLPKQCSRVQIGSVTHAIRIASSGTDGAAMGVNYQFVPANNLLTLRFGKGTTRKDSIFVAVDASSVTVHLTMEEL